MKASNKPPLKRRLAHIIFEADTPWSRGFDVVLLVTILLSVVLVVLETVEPLHKAYGNIFYTLEWCITGLFTLEYLARLTLARHPGHYAWSFFGLIDFLAILPTYLELFVAGPHYLMVIRVLRLLRLFRILKLTRYIRAEENIKKALKASRAKIVVFFGSVLSIMLVLGALMYLIEGPEHGFKNIPLSIYWAINTMTPVSESELAAKTVPGRVFAALLMFLGYALLAIPSGIVSSEITRASRYQLDDRICPSCGKGGHESVAGHCKFCGALLKPGMDDGDRHS